MFVPTRHWIALLTALLVCSCSTVSFYTQAVSGQMELSRKARPNATVLADAAVSANVKRKLRLIEELRAFAARELHLPTKSFGKFCDLKRPYVVWVVFASPEFSVEAKTWWYPFVGSLKYRGFFDENDAQREGARLRKQGLDVFVGGVDAYSTLGYLRDPVLNTFLHRSDADLAELVFHELTHAKVFIPGDTDFNEAFATANAENGVRHWYRSKGDLSGLRAYEASLKKGREVIGLLLRTREKLKSVYSNTYRSIETERLAKHHAFEAMLHEANQLRAKAGQSRLEHAAAQHWNNARLNTVATYYTLVPGFERLLKSHNGDLEAFHREVAAMRRLSPEKRTEALATK
ncbi:MAG: aminopeptidase [Prosthecobacter sp.]|uniref:aminopeptidase n=1 Tax=Prosthecobacter sp. TaxID=1965333 RepID=UPI0039010331